MKFNLFHAGIMIGLEPYITDIDSELLALYDSELLALYVIPLAII